MKNITSANRNTMENNPLHEWIPMTGGFFFSNVPFLSLTEIEPPFFNPDEVNPEADEDVMVKIPPFLWDFFIPPRRCFPMVRLDLDRE